MTKTKIAVAGIGYVALSNAVLLAQHNHVTAVDLNPERVALLNAGRAPIVDPEIETYLAERPLDLRATTGAAEAYRDAEFILIATPTNYDPRTNVFDTSSVEAVLEQILAVNARATVVIKSTVPVGYTASVSRKLQTDQVIFSPEFLREGRALYDNLHPSRIVVGEDSARGRRFAALLAEGAVDRDIPTRFTGPSEAEAVKLFYRHFTHTGDLA